MTGGMNQILIPNMDDNVDIVQTEQLMSTDLND